MPGALSYNFDHVHIYCTDLDASERWFVDGLGAELTRRRQVGGARAVDLRIGGATVFLKEQSEGENLGEPGPSRFGTDHLGLRVEDLDATAWELKLRGVEFEMEPKQVGPGLRIAFVRGPDNVRVEILQRDNQ